MKHILYMSLRSPFARRVRLALEELGIDYDAQALDVFNPPAGFGAVNPLGRVPALQLPTGETLIDSSMIFEHLRERHSEHPLFLFGGARPARARRLTGLALGVMETTVTVVLENMRGVVGNPAVKAEFTAMALAGLAALDDELRGAAHHALGPELRACDLDIGAAAAYCELRLGADCLKTYPALKAHLGRLNERASFRKTVPPA
ncbi:MAG: glutathione S-transferase family protein [Deltaproteobacteria bacterium]|nr:glutathione S-transferase family protein [Deltaproteobacteria bacterium]